MPYELASVTAHHNRMRQKSRRTIVSKLFRTHTLASGATFAPGTLFGTLDQPIVWAAYVTRNNAVTQGVVWESGTTTRAAAVWFDDADVGCCFGREAAADGVTVTAVGACPSATGSYAIIASCVPSTGTANLWVNGDLVGSATASSGGFSTTWTGTAGGGVGVVNTGVGNRVPLAQRVNLSGAVFDRAVEVYNLQYPWLERGAI